MTSQIDKSNDFTLMKLSESDQTLADDSADIRGNKVIDKDGQEIGDVNDLLIDNNEHRVRFLEVGAGGFLGISEKTFLIPVDAVTRVHDDHVHLGHTSKKIMDSPDYNPDLIREKRDVSNWEDTYRWYGYPGFWTSGYRYPGFPLV
ncbi:MAG: PRC-barrel domain-containing protein [Trueperaceae bacterium]|nr:PRC-barrel domain-containing protein [Trueperaceae bacterium]